MSGREGLKACLCPCHIKIDPAIPCCGCPRAAPPADGRAKLDLEALAAETGTEIRVLFAGFSGPRRTDKLADEIERIVFAALEKAAGR